MEVEAAVGMEVGTSTVVLFVTTALRAIFLFFTAIALGLSTFLQTVWQQRLNIIFLGGAFLICQSLRTQQEPIMQGADLVWSATVPYVIQPGSAVIHLVVVTPYEAFAPRINDFILYGRQCIVEFYEDLKMLACIAFDTGGQCTDRDWLALIVDISTGAIDLASTSNTLNAVFNFLKHFLLAPSRITSWRDFWREYTLPNGIPNLDLTWVQEIIDYLVRISCCYYDWARDIIVSLFDLSFIAHDCLMCKFYEEDLDGEGCLFMDGFNVSIGGEVRFETDFRTSQVCATRSLLTEPFDAYTPGLECHAPFRHFGQCTAGVLEPFTNFFGDNTEAMRLIIDGVACGFALWFKSPAFIFLAISDTLADEAYNLVFDPDVPVCINDIVEDVLRFVITVLEELLRCILEVLNGITDGRVDNILEEFFKVFFGFIWEVVAAIRPVLECSQKCHIQRGFQNWPETQDESEIFPCWYLPTEEECGGNFTIFSGWAYFVPPLRLSYIPFTMANYSNYTEALAACGDEVSAVQPNLTCTEPNNVFFLNDIGCLNLDDIAVDLPELNLSSAFDPENQTAGRVFRVTAQGRASHEYTFSTTTRTSNGSDYYEYDAHQGYCLYAGRDFWLFPTNGIHKVGEMFVQCVCAQSQARWRGPDDPGITDSPQSVLLIPFCDRIPLLGVNFLDIIIELLRAVDFIFCPFHGIIDCINLFLASQGVGDGPTCTERYGTWHGDNPGETTPNVGFTDTAAEEDVLPSSRYLYEFYETQCELFNNTTPRTLHPPKMNWATPRSATGTLYQRIYGRGELLDCGDGLPDTSIALPINDLCAKDGGANGLQAHTLYDLYVWPWYMCRNYIGRAGSLLEIQVISAPAGYHFQGVPEGLVATTAFGYSSTTDVINDMLASAPETVQINAVFNIDTMYESCADTYVSGSRTFMIDLWSQCGPWETDLVPNMPSTIWPVGGWKPGNPLSQNLEAPEPFNAQVKQTFTLTTDPICEVNVRLLGYGNPLAPPNGGQINEIDDFQFRGVYRQCGSASTSNCQPGSPCIYESTAVNARTPLMWSNLFNKPSLIQLPFVFITLRQLTGDPLGTIDGSADFPFSARPLCEGESDGQCDGSGGSLAQRLFDFDRYKCIRPSGNAFEWGGIPGRTPHALMYVKNNATNELLNILDNLPEAISGPGYDCRSEEVLPVGDFMLPVGKFGCNNPGDIVTIQAHIDPSLPKQTCTASSLLTSQIVSVFVNSDASDTEPQGLYGGGICTIGGAGVDCATQAVQTSCNTSSCTPSFEEWKNQVTQQIFTEQINGFADRIVNTPIASICAMVAEGSEWTFQLLDKHCELTDEMFDNDPLDLEFLLRPLHIWNQGETYMDSLNRSVYDEWRLQYSLSKFMVFDGDPVAAPQPLWSCDFVHNKEPGFASSNNQDRDQLDEFICTLDCTGRYALVSWFTLPVEIVFEILDDTFDILDCMFALQTIQDPGFSNKGACFDEMISNIGEIHLHWNIKSTVDEIRDALDGKHGTCGVFDWFKCASKCWNDTDSCTAANSGSKRSIDYSQPIYNQLKGTQIIHELVEYVHSDNCTLQNKTGLLSHLEEAMLLYWRENALVPTGVDPTKSYCGAVLWNHSVYFVSEEDDRNTEGTFDGCLRMWASGIYAKRTYPERFTDINEFLGTSSVMKAMGELMYTRVFQEMDRHNNDTNYTDSYEPDLEHEEVHHEDLSFNKRQEAPQPPGDVPPPRAHNFEWAKKTADMLLPRLEKYTPPYLHPENKTIKEDWKMMRSPALRMKDMMNEGIRRLTSSDYWSHTMEFLERYDEEMDRQRLEWKHAMVDDPDIANEVRIRNELELMQIFYEYGQKMLHKQNVRRAIDSVKKDGEMPKEVALRLLSEVHQSSLGTLTEIADAHQQSMDALKKDFAMVSRVAEKTSHAAQVMWKRYDLANEPRIQEAHLTKRALMQDDGYDLTTLRRFQKREIGYDIYDGVIPIEVYNTRQQGRTPFWKRGIIPAITGMFTRPENVTYGLFLIFEDFNVDEPFGGTSSNTEIEDHFNELNQTNSRIVEPRSNDDSVSFFIFRWIDAILAFVGIDGDKIVESFVLSVSEDVNAVGSADSFFANFYREARRAVACEIPNSISGEADANGRRLIWSPFCALLYEGYFREVYDPSWPNNYVPHQIPWPQGMVQKDCVNAPFNGKRFVSGGPSGIFGYRYTVADSCQLKIDLSITEPEVQLAACQSVAPDLWLSNFTLFYINAQNAVANREQDRLYWVTGGTSMDVDNNRITLNLNSTRFNNIFIRNITQETANRAWLDCLNNNTVGVTETVQFCGLENVQVTYDLENNTQTLSFDLIERCRRPFCAEGGSEIELDYCVQEYHTCEEIGYGDVADAIGYILAMIPLLIRWLVGGGFSTTAVEKAHIFLASPFTIAYSAYSVFTGGLVSILLFPFSFQYYFIVNAHVTMTFMFVWAWLFETQFGSDEISIAGTLGSAYIVTRYFYFEAVESIPFLQPLAIISLGVFVINKFVLSLDFVGDFSMIQFLVNVIEIISPFTWGETRRVLRSLEQRWAYWDQFDDVEQISSAFHFCFFYAAHESALAVLVLSIFPVLIFLLVDLLTYLGSLLAGIWNGTDSVWTSYTEQYLFAKQEQQDQILTSSQYYPDRTPMKEFGKRPKAYYDRERGSPGFVGGLLNRLWPPASPRQRKKKSKKKRQLKKED